MTVIVILVLGCVAGLVVGRWRSIGLGLAVWVLGLGAGIAASGRFTDTPAIFVAVVAALAIALGVTARHRLGSRSA